MGDFRFKRFTVRNEASAMKVNTDGVLLGGAMTVLPSDRCLLDAGTGTGTIALMAAQRLSSLSAGVPHTGKAPFSIYAIDSDAPSAAEAALNFRNSPWDGFLTAIPCPLEDYSPGLSFDLIFSNPPYFESSLKAPEPRRSSARHAVTMSYREILGFASSHLSPSGRVSLILPSDCERELLMSAASVGLHPFRILYVGTVQGKPFSRIIAEFSASRAGLAAPVREEMFIHFASGGYSDAYRSLLKDFLIIF
ncbi:MAG: tRNA1(Val) (adenine(37)-N6)-methyltransferase [Candidatus Cryptobacteroides sp.]